MLQFTYLPGEIIVPDSKEDRKAMLTLKMWLPDLELVLGTVTRVGMEFHFPMYPIRPHPDLENDLWKALEARDLLWASLLLFHMDNYADLYNVLEVLSIMPMPLTPLQYASWRSARKMMGNS